MDQVDNRLGFQAPDQQGLVLCKDDVRLPSEFHGVRKRNQSSPLARRAGVKAQADHGTGKATEFITTPNDFIPVTATPFR